MDIQNSRNRGGVPSETREESLVVSLSFKARDAFVDRLYESLLRAGIPVFIDEESGAPLTKAIGQSKIAIPILSKDYLSSKRCLQELVQMVQCRKKGQIIMPVFFNVKLLFAKMRSAGYKKAIARHGQKEIDSKTLQEREALSYVGSIRGLEIDSSGTDASLIDELVAKVLREQNRYLVDIEHHVQRVIKLLDVESSAVRVVGIHGIGGTRKTTLAKLVRNGTSRLFDGCSFLEIVRKNEERQVDLGILRDQLISDLLRDLGGTDRKIKSFGEGTKLIRNEFFDKKFLIVVDNVGASSQLEEILGNRDWLGPGSRIIITTRAEQALAELDWSQKHVVEGMQMGEALQLFHRHAFRGTAVLPGFTPLSRDIVSKIGRLPLLVEVFGLYLYSKSKDEWQKTLGKLKNVDEVQQKLAVIIDALPSKQRRIFLDIACFFNGEDESVACYLWSDHGSASGSELKMLVDLSIVKVENGMLWMHNQFRNLGRDIVRRDLPKSRSWSHWRALDVLRDKNGKESVEGVLLKFGSRLTKNFGPAHFAGMSKIRFLRLDQANLEGDFEGCLSSLRWLHWQGCPQNLLAKKLDLKELVILDLSRSNVSEKWMGWIQIQKSEKLKVLNLADCDNLTGTPDLSHFTCLERLILEGCKHLRRIDRSVKSLQGLVSLNLRFCSNLKKLPDELGSLRSLEEILIDNAAVEEIPDSIGHLPKLKRLSACNCYSLTEMPESISHVEFVTLNHTQITELPLPKELGELKYLSIRNCSSIIELPSSFQTLASLSELDLSSTQINELPDTINDLSHLRVLKIDFTFVRELPPAIWKLKMLEELHASGCPSLEGKIPGDIENLSALRVLKLGYSRICGLPYRISRLSNLQTLDLLHCDQLPEVPKLPSSLISLSVSSVLMDNIPDISSLVKLRELVWADGSQEPVLSVQDQIEEKECTYLQLGSLSELKILQLSALKIQLLPIGLHYLLKLRKLSLCCIHLKKLPRLPPGLFALSLRHYKSQRMPDLSYLVLLSEFELSHCAVREVPGLGKFKSLRVFTASHCHLKQVNELENLIFLASLKISHCQSLERLPDRSKLKMLKYIKIKGCQKIPVDGDCADYHWSLSERSNSTNDSSKAGSSKSAKTKHSSSKGFDSIYEGNEGGIDNIRSNDDQLKELNSHPDRGIKWSKIDKNFFISDKKIGMGSNGTIVYEGMHEGRCAAVKCLVRGHLDDARVEYRNLILSDQHKNIVRYYGMVGDPKFVYLALEHCICSLDDLIQALSGSSDNSVKDEMQDVNLWSADGYPSPQLLKVMRDVVSGLSHLHNLRMIHRDIKPQNVLITKNPSFGAKLSDMGISKCLPKDKSSLGNHATVCGTIGWRAPEQRSRGERQTQKMDMFSLGCVLFFCVTRGEHPFGEPLDRDSNIGHDRKDLSRVKFIPEAHDLISRLLHQDPTLRPKASEVRYHPFLWSSKRRLTFLRDVSDKIKSEDGKGNSGFLKKLEKTAQSIFKRPWDEIIDSKIMNHLGRFVTYDGGRVKSLLRAVRNKVNHHQEAPVEVEKIHGRFPDGLDAYFAKKFPRLLIESYKVAYEVWKNDPHLKKYFLFGELK